MRRGTLVVTCVLLLAASPAAAQHAHPPKADSDAPAGAPPHWIPSSQWVLNHWLPYDEATLLRLLRVDRSVLWAHLRDDRRTLGELAAQKGWSTQRLARELVADRRVLAVPRTTLAARAQATLDQGHMSQHILFHTLHQEVLPSRAQRIFGVSTARFRTLRRADLSPLEIARTAERGRMAVTRAADAALREMARRGVAQGAVSPAQAKLVLDRQRRQLPRWLEHRRYNGPPPTDAAGKLEAPLVAHALSPSVSDDGRLVAFEQAQPKIPLAVRDGEIGVQLRRVADGSGATAPGAVEHVGHGAAGAHGPGAQPAPAARAPGAGPCSAYTSRLAGDGHVVVLETTAGNATFAKRYGRPQVVRADLRAGTARAVSPPGATAYHPTVSADGRTVAFTVAPERGAVARVAVWRDGRTTTLPGIAHEPALAEGGRHLAFVRPRSGRIVVVVRDLRTGREREVRAGADAGEPVLSADGRTLAFTAGRSVVVVRDGRRERLPVLGGRGNHAPALSADGRHLAVAVTRTGDGPGGRPRQDLRVVDLATMVVKRVATGTAYAAHPSLSALGTVLAFTATGARGVQEVRATELRTGAVRRVSGGPGEAGVAAPCAEAPPVW